jgi:hypothetical protein
MTNLIESNAIGFGPVPVFLLASCSPPAACALERDDGTKLAMVLSEQLNHLIRHADEERDRFERVKSVLLEVFN